MADRLIEGICAPDFAHVGDVFEGWAARDPSVGMAVAVYQEGRPVVDLWTGLADGAQRRPWSADTLVCMMSVAKGISALCLHVLADRGRLDLDAPVAAYWPSFAGHGKDGILVRHILDHTAGLPFVEVDRVGLEALDEEVMTRALERARPLAEPGVQRAYHPVTMGYLAGALVRAVTGVSIGTFFRREIAEPNEFDYWIGLPRALHGRCAVTGGAIGDTIFGAARRQPDSLLGRAMRQVPAELLNDPGFRTSEVPAINGHGTARSIARLYGMLVDPDAALLSKEALARATTLSWSGIEQTMGHQRDMALGFILADEHVPMGRALDPRAFGHPGAGGSIAFADPVRRLGVCFTTNKLYAGPGLNPRMVDVCSALDGPPDSCRTTKNN